MRLWPGQRSLRLHGAARADRHSHGSHRAIVDESLLRRPRLCAAVLAGALTVWPATIGGAISAADLVLEDEEASLRRILVTRNKSRTIRFVKPFSTAVVGTPEIADVLPMSNKELFIQGKKLGTTNVSVFDADKKMMSVLDLEVALDIDNIRRKIRAGTASRGIEVSGSNGQVVLAGEARDSVDAERAVAIARSMVMPPDSDGKVTGDPGSYIINAMRIAPSQQVVLRVRFIEVSRQAERDIGVNWFGSNRDGTRGINTGLGRTIQAGTVEQSTIGTLNRPTPGGLPLFETLATFAGGSLSLPFGVGLLNLVRGNTNIDVLVTALEEKGLARRLAEPDVVALSGDTASFLAGGEYPVPSVQSSSGTVPIVTTEYKPFGVQLTFVPTVLANGIINLRLTPSVSELDYRNAVSIAGTLVPALSKREARTVIELRDGQSFGIAGLLQSDNLRDVAQIPWLGSVPVLGALFRSSSYQQSETDLVVIVTHHLVAPAAPGQILATPFDKQLPSNDIDFFLMGRPEVRKQYTDYVTTGGQLTGPYGHMISLEQK